jgi:hypothetical protein
MRPITGLITILLPLAHHLNATEILSIIMAMYVACLVWETVGSLKKGACFFERWSDVDYPETHQQEERPKDNEAAMP